MGMFTTILAPFGKSCQIKTGWDTCATFRMLDKIPWEPDPSRPGDHIDGVHLGYGERDNDTLVVIRGCAVMAILPREWDKDLDIQIAMLKKEYGVKPPDRSLWSEEAWAEKEARDRVEKEKELQWQKDHAHLTPAERMAARLGEYIKRKMDEPSVTRQILPPAENKIKGYQIRFDGPPGPEAGRFIEVEDRNGKSIHVGSWEPDGSGNGHWLLIIDDPVTVKGPQIPCPNDTDGDGNCGQPACPYCGPKIAIMAQVQRQTGKKKGRHGKIAFITPNEKGEIIEDGEIVGVVQDVKADELGARKVCALCEKACPEGGDYSKWLVLGISNSLPTNLTDEFVPKVDFYKNVCPTCAERIRRNTQ